MICECGDCYACSLRAKGLQLSPAATPNRNSTRRPVIRPMEAPSWEAGGVYEERPGGHRMPILAPGSTSRTLTVKERNDMGANLTRQLDRLHKDPNVLSTPRSD